MSCGTRSRDNCPDGVQRGGFAARDRLWLSVVSFRFYVVATVAWFLALAVGVVVGSALDEAIVTSLRDRVDSVETNLDAKVAVIDAKDSEIAQLNEAVDGMTPFAVDGRVDQTSTILVAESGLDNEAVAQLGARLVEGGSAVQGVVWLEESWSLEDDSLRQSVAAAVATDATTPSGVRSAAWAAVFGPLTGDVGAPTSENTSTPTATPSTSVPPAVGIFTDPTVTALAELGVLRLEAFEGPVPDAGRPVVVSLVGPQTALAGVGAQDLISAAGDSTIPLVVGEVSDGSGPRGVLLTDVLRSNEDGLSGVDNVDQPAGRVSVVLALAELLDGGRGRYGIGDGAERAVPEWTGPS